jgi:uncharacterized protein
MPSESRTAKRPEHMARFERSGLAEGPVVQGFAGGGFLVEGQAYEALLMTPERAMAWDAPAFDVLSIDAFVPLLDLDPPPEFVILGTGPSHRIAPRPLVAALEARGIGVESMDSRAAARTWGLLRGEGRWIVAAIMPLR